MKKKSIIILLLIIVSLAVWSRNIYLIIVGIKQSDEPFIEQPITNNWDLPDTMVASEPEQISFVYQAKYRDPFQHWLAPPKPAISEQTLVEIKEPPIPVPPPLRFSGILSDSSGILAIIEGQNGQTYFTHVSDTIEGIIILQIENHQVECQFEGEKFVLELRP